MKLSEITDFDRWFLNQGKKKSEPKHDHKDPDGGYEGGQNVFPQPEDELAAKVDHIVINVAHKLRKLGVRTNNGDVETWLCGGGGWKNQHFLDELANIGYDDGATSYEENEEFWKKVGMSKEDYDDVVEYSS